MPLLHRHALPFLLHLLRPHGQGSNETDLLLPLRFHSDDVALLQRVFLIGKTAPSGRETGRHERGAGEDEADCTAVDLDRGEGVWVGVQETEVGDGRVVEALEEEGRVVDGVEGCAFGSVGVSMVLVFV